MRNRVYEFEKVKMSEQTDEVVEQYSPELLEKYK